MAQIKLARKSAKTSIDTSASSAVACEVLFDGIIRCTDIEKHYGLAHIWQAFRYGKKHPKASHFSKDVVCCYEPVPLFLVPKKPGEKVQWHASIPFLIKPVNFKKGKRYRIKIEEVK